MGLTLNFEKVRVLAKVTAAAEVVGRRFLILGILLTPKLSKCEFFGGQAKLTLDPRGIICTECLAIKMIKECENPIDFTRGAGLVHYQYPHFFLATFGVHSKTRFKSPLFSHEKCP